MKTTVINSEFVVWAQAETVKGTKFHAVLCDPPYGLNFMGNEWDTHKNFQQAAKSWGEALLPLLHPGAITMMFSGTRTWHRLAAGMEDAGFEVWDTLMWLYGTGFPKGQDIGKLVDKKNGNKPGFISAAWDGYKTPALKPAWEPVVCFRAPRQGLTYAECALQFGSGCLHVDGGRIGDPVPPTGSGASHNYGWANCEKETEWKGSAGRYPANLILDEEAGEMLGSSSRFFYCAKASSKERGEGNNHATVKPIALCQYLATLVLPPPSVPNHSILVPFSGSGSEMIGTMLAGWDNIIGVEQDKRFCEIAEIRLEYHKAASASGDGDTSHIC
jgi:DNA modification methylase